MLLITQTQLAILYPITVPPGFEMPTICDVRTITNIVASVKNQIQIVSFFFLRQGIVTFR